VVAEPVVQPAKSIAAGLHFDAAINAEQRHAYIAAAAATRSATKRHALRGEAAVLKQAYDRAFGSIPFLP
jgi:hypothetical protein